MALIYDTFCLFNELDLLELRLNFLGPNVDVFMICESRETFSGKDKPLNLIENLDRFSQWAGKIRYVVPNKMETNNPFERAAYQKDFIREALNTVAKDDDIIYFGDLDEIWKPQEIIDDKMYNLKQLNYAYYLNNRSSEEWIGTVVGKWGTFKTNSVNHWRATHTNVIEDGGWHFTNMGGIEQILKKIESYDHHLEADIPWVKDGLEERIKNNKDYLGRDHDWKGQPFKMWVEEDNLPRYIINNRRLWVDKGLWK